MEDQLQKGEDELLAWVVDHKRLAVLIAVAVLGFIAGAMTF